MELGIKGRSVVIVTEIGRKKLNLEKGQNSKLKNMIIETKSELMICQNKISLPLN